MKRNSGGRGLSGIMLLLGILALVLRKTLYGVAVDAKGLLLRGHPLAIALTALTGAALVIVVLSVRKSKAHVCGEESYSASFLGAFGNVAAGAGILVTVLTGTPGMWGSLADAWGILGLAAPVCLALAGIARLLGKRPFFLLHVVVCLFFLVHIVTRYQIWSSNPQLQDYVFSLLGAMSLLLFVFYTAAGEAGCGNLSMKIGMGQTAIYLCLAELARSSCPVLYLGGILWVLTDLVSMEHLSDEKK